MFCHFCVDQPVITSFSLSDIDSSAPDLVRETALLCIHPSKRWCSSLQWCGTQQKTPINLVLTASVMNPPPPQKKEKTCIYSATWTTLQWKSPNRSDKRPEKLDYSIKLVSKVTSWATGHEVSNFKYLALSLLTKDHKINQVTKNEFTLYIIGKQMQCWTWVTWMEKKRF